MAALNTLAFGVYPYVALTIFVMGHIYQYFYDPLQWNSRSSEILEKNSLKIGITLFHWGVILTLLGHTGGLLIPQRVFDMVGIDGRMHTSIALSVGMVVGTAAFIGVILLIWRRLSVSLIVVTTAVSDVVVLFLLLMVIGTGLYNVFWGHYSILDTIAPWIRGIVTLTPDPGLMVPVPLSYKIHILTALTLIAFSPFSRLVHIWSVPVLYLYRPFIVYRRRVTGPDRSGA